MINEHEREIMTFSGEMFDFYNPDPATINIKDIAHHLALINRYTGATRVPYSVAEHCVRASYLPDGDPLLNLLHDSAEAYINDIAKPQKNGLGWRFNHGGFGVSYEQIEAEILRRIGTALDIPALKSWLAAPPSVKQADLIMLLTEVRDLMPSGALDVFRRAGCIPDGALPSLVVITPWDWRRAEELFLLRYEELI